MDMLFPTLIKGIAARTTIYIHAAIWRHGDSKDLLSNIGDTICASIASAVQLVDVDPSHEIMDKVCHDLRIKGRKWPREYAKAAVDAAERSEL